MLGLVKIDHEKIQQIAINRGIELWRRGQGANLRRRIRQVHYLTREGGR